jgi:hypothetical protein
MATEMYLAIESDKAYNMVLCLTEDLELMKRTALMRLAELRMTDGVDWTNVYVADDKGMENHFFRYFCTTEGREDLQIVGFKREVDTGVI